MDGARGGEIFDELASAIRECWVKPMRILRAPEPYEDVRDVEAMVDVRLGAESEIDDDYRDTVTEWAEGDGGGTCSRRRGCIGTGVKSCMGG